LAKYYDIKTIFDMGNPVRLSDGSYLVGLSIVANGNVGSYDDMAMSNTKWEQKVVWFDSQFKKIKSTVGIQEKTLVAPIAPTIKSLQNGVLTFTFDSGDAGAVYHSTYTLNLVTFDWARV
jgi:hypothetical protein